LIIDIRYYINKLIEKGSTTNMKYRKMGSLDWEVSALGFGCMRLPARRLNRLRADTNSSIKIIKHGIDLGINYIDTAWFYHLGDSEKILGKVLKGSYRDKVHLVTKLPIQIVRKTEDFETYLNQQLKRLKTDYIDGYLFHGVNKGTFSKLKKLGLIEKMEKARDKGLIKYIGFSFHDTFPVFKEIIDYYDWDIAQIQYNYMDTKFQAKTEGLEYAHSKGIAVVVMEPLKGGKLVNPPAEAIEIIRSAKSKKSPVEWALQFLWNRPEVSVVISGMGSMQMVDQNSEIADRSGINTLNKDDEEIISRLAKAYHDKILVPCTACDYCMPCPSGVNIPQNFAILNDAYIDSSKFRSWLTRRGYKSLVGSKEKLDKDNPNGNASMCTECNKCLEKCPQKIAIPDELKKVHSILGKRGRISDHYEVN
jgi:predicted aldo/keto reductase-like oxidoreductase